MPEIGLNHFLIVSALLFSAGIGVVISRKNAIAVLCGVELILNAAALNFVAFNRYSTPDARLDGQIFTIFIIILAAAEAAVALAILLNLFQQTNTVDVDEADTMKE